tara:strand:- start:41 stop:169 length:129 start_codon:yes stop_codon:yes gene_type:complete
MQDKYVNKYSWTEQKKIVQDYFKLIKKKKGKKNGKSKKQSRF